MFKESETMKLVPVQKGQLARAKFDRLADVPPEEEWLANITNQRTKRAYREDVREFVAYAGMRDYVDLRSVVRAHVIDWRKDMEKRGLAPPRSDASFRRFHHSSITCANAMPSPAILSTA